MKINNKHLIIAALSCWPFTACCNDNTFFNEPPQIRAYKTDAEVLSQFVDVDSRTGLFSINPNKKVTATDRLQIQFYK